jgi:pilus assembly protein CpaD
MTPSRTRILGAAATLGVLLLAACASNPKSPAIGARTPTELYPLKAAPAPDQIALGLHAEGLSPAQADALKLLAKRRKENEGGSVTVSAPHGGADPALAAAMQTNARALLLEQGVPADAIKITAYETADAKAPLLISYTFEKADVAACGKKWDDLTHTEDNRVQSNFGCAVSANMAALIANPADIAHPRDEDAPDAQRRQTVLGAYAQGKTTSAQADPNTSSGLSKVGQ